MFRMFAAIFTLLAAVPAAAQEAAPEGDGTMVLILVIGFFGALVLFAFVASKLQGKPDPETKDEYPLPLDLDN